MPDAPTTMAAADVLHDPAVVEALRTARHADAEVERARRTATIAKDELAFALFVACAPFRSRGASETAIPQELAHELYWEMDDVRAADVARAFGVSTAKLSRLAGPREADGTCSGCQEATRVVRTSRSDDRDVRCEGCREREEAERRQREQERRQQEAAWRDQERSAYGNGAVGPNGETSCGDPYCPDPYCRPIVDASPGRPSGPVVEGPW